MSVYRQQQKMTSEDSFLFPGLHSFTLTNIGTHLIIFGGINEQKLFSQQFYSFDIADQSWCEVETPKNGQQIPARFKHASQLIFSNKILIIGGFGAKIFNDVWLFDHKHWTCNKLQPLQYKTEKIFSPRFGHHTFVSDGQVYVLLGKGGHQDLAEAKDLAEVYKMDLDDMYMRKIDVNGLQDWMKGSNFTGLPLNDEFYFMLGNNLRKIVLFSAQSHNFMTISTMGANPCARNRYSLTESVEEGQIILVGGTDQNNYFNDAYALSFPKELKKLSFSWKQVELITYTKKYQKFSVFPGIQSHATVFIDNGIMVLGGIIKNRMYTDTTLEQPIIKGQVADTGKYLIFNQDIFYIDCRNFLEMDYLPQKYRETQKQGLFSAKAVSEEGEYPCPVFQADLLYWEKIERMVIYGGVMKSNDEKDRSINEQHVYTNVLQTFDPIENTWEAYPVNNGLKMSCHRQFQVKKRLFLYGGTDGVDTYKDIMEIVEEGNKYYMLSIKVKELIMPRISPVVWTYKTDVYVFGGFIASKGLVFDMHVMSMRDMNDLSFKEVSFVPLKHLNQKDSDMTENQKKELAQIPIKPRGRMFAAQTIHQHLGVLMGGISGDIDQKMILNDLWAFDFIIQRWVELHPLNGQHQCPQFYGHTISVYNSQVYKNKLASDKKNYDLYINKKKATKKKVQKDTQVIDSQQDIDIQTNNQMITNNSRTTKNSKHSTKKKENEESQFDLESQTIDPNSAVTLMSGKSSRTNDPLKPKKAHMYTDENILTKIEEFSLNQQTIYNFDILIQGGSSHMITNYTTTAQQNSYKIRVYLEKTVFQEKILNAKYSQAKMEVVRRRIKRKEEQQQRRLKRKKRHEELQEQDEDLQQQLKQDDTESEESEDEEIETEKYFEHGLNVYEAQYNLFNTNVINQDSQGRIFHQVTTFNDRIWLFGGIADANIYFVNTHKNHITDIKNLNKVIDFDGVFTDTKYLKQQHNGFVYDDLGLIDSDLDESDDNDRFDNTHKKRNDILENVMIQNRQGQDNNSDIRSQQKSDIRSQQKTGTSKIKEGKKLKSQSKGTEKQQKKTDNDDTMISDMESERSGMSGNSKQSRNSRRSGKSKLKENESLFARNDDQDKYLIPSKISEDIMKKEELKIQENIYDQLRSQKKQKGKKKR